MEMDITFHEKTITTTVYIKMDAVDQLLLSEGVCRQLGIVMYHTSVVPQTDTEQLRTFLGNNHDAFSLEEGERGETSLVTDTGDANNHHDVCRSWFGKR